MATYKLCYVESSRVLAGEVEAPKGLYSTYQSRPHSAKDTVLVPATTKWSRTLTSTKASACLRFCVSNSSARLGSATPEGWLCANKTAAAFCANAAFTTSRGYTLV